MKKPHIIAVALIILIIGATLILTKSQKPNTPMMQDNLIEDEKMEEVAEVNTIEKTPAVAGELPMINTEAKPDSENGLMSDSDKGSVESIEVEAKPAPVSTKTIVDWKNYVKPSQTVLKQTLDSLAYKVTQEEGTERAGTSPLDKVYERGIYVDILSGEPLFSSKNKYDSGTGWPSFTAPISEEAVTEHIDRKLFSTRTEIRSAIADNHLGHVFTDGPQDSTGLRYCMNGVALRFIPEAEMVEKGYGDWMGSL